MHYRIIPPSTPPVQPGPFLPSTTIISSYNINMQRHIRWQQHASFIVFILTYNNIMDSLTRMSNYLWNCTYMSLYEVANLSWYHKICMTPKIYIVSSTLFISYVLFHFLLYSTYHVIRIHMFYSPLWSGMLFLKLISRYNGVYKS